jgi:hypothetical protein
MPSGAEVENEGFVQLADPAVTGAVDAGVPDGLGLPDGMGLADGAALPDGAELPDAAR